MGRFLLTRYYTDFNFPETGILQPAVKIALGKTKPPVAIGFASFVKVMLQKVQDHDLASSTQQPVCGRNCDRGIFSMVQSLAKNDQVHALRIDGRILQVTQSEFEIF